MFALIDVVRAVSDHPSMPTEPEREQNGILIANYGIAMFNAQSLEQSIAVLCLSIHFGKLRDRENRERNEEQAQRLFDRFWQEFQLKSVGTQLSFLKANLSEELYDDIAAWIDRRNEIAHRFLVRQYIATGPKAHTFVPGTMDTIAAFARDCKPLEKRVFQDAEQRVRTAKIPQEVRDMGTQFIHTVMLRDEWPEDDDGGIIPVVDPSEPPEFDEAEDPLAAMLAWVTVKDIPTEAEADGGPLIFNDAQTAWALARAATTFRAALAEAHLATDERRVKATAEMRSMLVSTLEATKHKTGPEVDAARTDAMYWLDKIDNLPQLDAAREKLRTWAGLARGLEPAYAKYLESGDDAALHEWLDGYKIYRADGEA